MPLLRKNYFSRLLECFKIISENGPVEFCLTNLKYASYIIAI